jgi:hypothetical protein
VVAVNLSVDYVYAAPPRTHHTAHSGDTRVSIPFFNNRADSARLLAARDAFHP